MAPTRSLKFIVNNNHYYYRPLVLLARLAGGGVSTEHFLQLIGCCLDLAVHQEVGCVTASTRSWSADAPCLWQDDSIFRLIIKMVNALTRGRNGPPKGLGDVLAS